MKPEAILDCAGKAQRRRRFRLKQDFDTACQSGVALRLPPQSKIAGWLAVTLLSVATTFAQADRSTQNGRSTKSFIAERHLEKVVNALKLGDFVIIQLQSGYA